MLGWLAAAALALALRPGGGEGGAGGEGGGLLPLEAEALAASVGGFAVLNCHLDFPFGHEIPYRLDWDKDGEPVYSWHSGAAGPELGAGWAGRVRRVQASAGLGRGAINVSAVRESDAGLYRCRVSFPNRTPPARNDGTYRRLRVQGGGLIAAPPLNVTVREGERAELECRPARPGARVHWLRDGAPLPAAAAPNGSLVLPAAGSGDPGRYECRVSDERGAAHSASAYLDVHYAAKVVHAPAERFLPLGKPASLDCHFSANPPLTNLRWEKDGFLFDPYNVPGVFYSRNGSLLFNQVDESHEGQYSCTPYNALGTAGASPRVRVRVLRPPALAVRPNPLYVARLGAELTLPCAAEPGAGAAPVAWRRADGAPLPAGRATVGAAGLTLAPVAEEDRGAYVCSAGGEAGGEAGVAAETELVVEGAPPRAPRALAAAPRATALHVSWRAAGAGLEYAVWYRARGAAEWRTLRVLTRGLAEATLTGLRPATEYEVRVLSQDALGDGLFSRPLFARTLDAEEAEGAGAEEAVGAEEEEAPTEPAAPWEAAADSAEDAEGAEDGLAVSVRLVDAGALVRWAGAAAGARCSLRWFRGDAQLAAHRTSLDYYLVESVSEGGEYWARVRCGARAGRGGARVPAWGRLRAAAAAAAGAALLLALLAAALYAARRRLRRAAPAPPRAAPAPPRAAPAPPPPKRR